MVDFAITLNESLEKQIPPTINKFKMQDEGHCAYCRHKIICSQREKELKDEVKIL